MPLLYASLNSTHLVLRSISPCSLLFTPLLSPSFACFPSLTLAGDTSVYKEIYKALGQDRHKRGAVYINDLYREGMIDPVALMTIAKRSKRRCSRERTDAKPLWAFLDDHQADDWLVSCYKDIDSYNDDKRKKRLYSFLKAVKKGNRAEMTLKMAYSLPHFLLRSGTLDMFEDTSMMRGKDMSDFIADILIQQGCPTGYLLLAEKNEFANTLEGLQVMIEAEQKELALPKIYHEFALAYLYVYIL